ncbi:energy transducer TonB [Pseudidiomarina terrestris]|uniref:Energy transducer TonB n=1 Tax=Pseudidiomarina terrestris TaxID=2820060 RepID=A0AAW7QUJ5_9GAMM|nr:MULTISPECIES: energy transducer TonB [unclassified Pseudidiomarina]MDN7123935.1 energy transducer TonB [Pseudidiomarina sp. 1APP75-32.1]MDN7130435.1 energy transducer TonB [Pseudidiomarina sp. 1APR75-15]MDN7136358.1 energy transducer TonB [Pseudidiomarina sp. 1ASP75-5]MDN7138725.1 energy transducer TonB [Pseudidiomarina sp. 1ASP75-14]MEA3588812.1 energy transducer TonB [Pseudidiomarina sp. 1APP75-27a]
MSDSRLIPAHRKVSRLRPLLSATLLGLAVMSASVSSAVHAAPVVQESAKQNFQEVYQAFQQAEADPNTPKSELQQLAFASYMRGREYFGADHINTANLALNHLLLLDAAQRVGEQQHALAALVVRVFEDEYGSSAIELLDPLLLALETMPEVNEERISDYELKFAEIFSARKTENPTFVLAVKTAMAEQLLRLNQSRPNLWTSLYQDSREQLGEDHPSTIKTAFYAAMEDAGNDRLKAAIDKLERVVSADAAGKSAVIQLQLAAYYRLVSFYGRLDEYEKVTAALTRLGQMNNELGGGLVEEALFRVTPEFPAAEAQAGREGSVELIYDVGRNGRPQNIRIVSETSAAFGQSARDAVAGWLYVPAYENGNPVVRKNVEVQLDFALQKD